MALVEGDPNLVEWLQHYARLVRVSVFTVAEMYRGLIHLEDMVAALIDHTVKARRQARLTRERAWYVEVTGPFADRVEPIDIVAEKWAEVSVRFPSSRDADKAVTATALAKGYEVATENLDDVRRAVDLWQILSTLAPGRGFG